MEIMWLLISVFGFALFDFFGYNLAIQKNLIKEYDYRIVQTTVQLWIFVMLMGFVNTTTAIVFMILWFTFNCDWLYYFYCIIFGWVFGITKEWKQPFKNVIRWGWWTPMGLIKLFFDKEKTVIPGGFLVAQSLLGIIILLKTYNII